MVNTATTSTITALLFYGSNSDSGSESNYGYTTTYGETGTISNSPYNDRTSSKTIVYVLILVTIHEERRSEMLHTGARLWFPQYISL